jgi:GTP cyclohydrolase II
MRGTSAVFHTFNGLSDGKEHFALGFGDWERQGAPLVRLHSECMTGDVLGSGRCDCGEQLAEAIERMSREGGLLLYLRQEGRGIGLYSKLDAYALQDLGFDTFEANRFLKYPEDSRSYAAAAQMLRALDATAVRLLTNNPDKVAQLRGHGIRVTEVLPTGVYVKKDNERYLKAKADKAGHRLKLAPEA